MKSISRISGISLVTTPFVTAFDKDNDGPGPGGDNDGTLYGHHAGVSTSGGRNNYYMPLTSPESKTEVNYETPVELPGFFLEIPRVRR